jgi:talin
LLGITKSTVVRLAVETKQILTEWKLTHLRRWAATPRSFTLDFGDYSDSYYQVETNEGEEISRLIAGYIEILVKKRNQLSTLTPETQEEERAIVEDYVRPEKASNVAIVSNPATAKQAKVIGSNNMTYGTTTKNGIRQGVLAENLEVVEAQQLLLKLIKNRLETLSGSLRDLAMPMQRPIVNSDPSALKWKADAIELNSRALAVQISNFLSAVAAMVQYSTGNADSMNYETLGVMVISAVNSVSQSIYASRVLSALTPSNDSQQKLLDASVVIIESTSNFLKELQTVVGGHKILNDFHVAALQIASDSNLILQLVDELEVPENTQVRINDAVQDVDATVNRDIVIGKQSLPSIKNAEAKPPFLKMLEESRLSSKLLTVITQVLAPTISTPICREQLIEAAASVRENTMSLQDLSGEINDSNCIDELKKCVLDTEDSLAYLIEQARTLDHNLEYEIGIYHNQIQAVGTELLINIGSN